MAVTPHADAVEEAEANHFALCLLLPADLVRKEVRAMGGIDVEDEKEVRSLARKFSVSPTLMAFRLGQLSAGRAPAARQVRD